MENDKKIFVKVRAVIMHEGKLLAVRHKYNSSHLALPGGHLEWGEDVKECLTREIVEELGVKPEVGRLLYINTFTNENRHYVEFLFEVTNGADFLDTEKLIRSHSYEVNQIVWVNQADEIKLRPERFADDFKSGKIISNEVRYLKG